MPTSLAIRFARGLAKTRSPLARGYKHKTSLRKHRNATTLSWVHDLLWRVPRLGPVSEQPPEQGREPLWGPGLLLLARRPQRNRQRPQHHWLPRRGPRPAGNNRGGRERAVSREHRPDSSCQLTEPREMSAVPSSTSNFATYPSSVESKDIVALSVSISPS